MTVINFQETVTGRGSLEDNANQHASFSEFDNDLLNVDLSWLTQSGSVNDSKCNHAAPHGIMGGSEHDADSAAGCKNEKNHSQKSQTTGENQPTVLHADHSSEDSSGVETDATAPRRQSCLLKGKLRQTLEQNVKTRGAQSSRIQSKVRQESMAIAMKDVEKIQEKEIHPAEPFIGLPSKVPELFASLRGITELYGKQMLIFISN